VDVWTPLPLLKYGESVDEKDIRGRTALHYSVLKGSKEIVALIIVYNASIDARDNRCRTPLHRAVYGKDIGIAACLLDSGAPVRAKDDCGRTQIRVAALLEDTTMMNFFLVYAVTPRAASCIDNRA
jgi:ankyrin repeat protein